jgi:hypothetical protein
MAVPVGRRPVVLALTDPPAGRSLRSAREDHSIEAVSATAYANRRRPRRPPLEAAAALSDATFPVQEAVVVEERDDPGGRPVVGEPAAIAPATTVRA